MIQSFVKRAVSAWHKRGQGLPISTIILAILGIVVLIMLIFILLRKGGEFGRATTDCTALGGECIPGDNCRVFSTGLEVGNAKCATGVCCRVLVPGRENDPCQYSIECGAQFECRNSQCVRR